MPTVTAEEIVARCAGARDEAAWREFVQRFEGDLRRGIRRVWKRGWVQSIICDEADLMQECYCKLLSGEGWRLRRCRSRAEPAIRAYLSKIAENVAIDTLRATSAAKRGAQCRIEERRVRGTLCEHAADLAPTVEELLILRQEHAAFLRQCQKAVTGPCAKRNFRILVLALVAGLRSDEIIEALGLSMTASSIDSIVSRARRKLARQGCRTIARRQPLARRSSTPIS